MSRIARGIWPTMITPFTEDNEIDDQALRRMMDWYVQQGCDGVFAVCQSSEMFFLTLQERVHLARRCVEFAGGRIQVIASGHVSERMEDQVEELHAIWLTGVRAVVLVSNRLAKQHEDDDVWIANAQHLLNALPGVTFGMYECPYPYKRLITPKTMTWMVSTGRFAFLKDTCCHAPTIQKRLQIIREHTPEGTAPMGLFNANTMTLLESLRDGADGFCGVMGNLHPDLYKWLFCNYQKEPVWARDLQAGLTMLSKLEANAYPVCAKKHMQDLGISMSLVTRTCLQERFSYTDQETLRQAEHLESLLRRIYLKGQAYSPRWHTAPSKNFRWNAEETYPVVHSMPSGMRRQIIHRADETYPFLHDTMITALHGRLLCAWYNCSENEIVGKTVIRGRWSDDHGESWSEPQVIAQADAGSGLHMVPAIFSEEGGIYAYITEMCAHDRPVGYGVYQYSGAEWVKIAHHETPALFNMQPIRLCDGRLMSAGRVSDEAGKLPLIPCVYLSDSQAPAAWRSVHLPGPWQYGCYPLPFPETTLLAEGAHLTAVIRNEGGAAQVCESHDLGQTWSDPRDAGLPIAASKMCGGTLSNGIQYLIYNEKTKPASRNRLVIALRGDGKADFTRVYTIFDGEDEQLDAGPMWHYPCAVEHVGRLYVSCTASRMDDVRRHAAFAIIPVESLTL